jgi:hypothetical protein
MPNFTVWHFFISLKKTIKLSTNKKIFFLIVRV